MEKTNKIIVSKDKLSEAGVYFGQRTAQWNPKMKPYILTTKNRVHIIDIMKTQKTLDFSYSLIKRYADKGADFIFVGTRKQAKATIKENALRTNSFYMSERWLGGTLTNNKTIFQRVKRMQELEKLAENNYEGYTKKEGVDMAKELAKLQKNLNGIREMRRKPQVMIVADPMADIIAVKEAKKLGIKVFGIIDTNVDPSIVDVAIPGNDDSIKSVSLIITILADAIADSKNGEVLFAYQPDDKIQLPEDLVPEWKKKKKFVKRRFDKTRNFKKEDGKDIEVKIAPIKESSKTEESKVDIPKTEETPKDIPKTEETPKDISKLKVAELRNLAKEKDIKGFSTMKKVELVESLK